MILALLLAVSIGMSKAALPVDTLRVDSVTTLGVAVPTRVLYTPGDINFDGQTTLSDVLSLAYHVLMAKPLPTQGDTLGLQFYTVGTADTVHYIFIPTKGVKR